MQPAVKRRTEPAEVVAIPVFDDHRRQLNRWIAGIDAGRLATVQRSVAKTLLGLLRVRGSKRHTQFAGYLELAHQALSEGQAQGARYVLISAAAALGWHD